jgi:heme-degrading monooxygenase HmoA
MTFSRIGVYTLTGAAPDVTRQATEGMLPILQRQPGFVDYQLVTAEDKVISISTWQTEAQATEGSKQAATFVAEQRTPMTLDHSYVGDVTLSSRS